MLNALIAAALVSASLSVDPALSSSPYARDRLLNEFRPYPPNRTDNPARAELGRLWHPRFPVSSRTPIRERVGAQPGPASYGAPAEAFNDRIYTLDGLVSVSINPWERIETGGLKRREFARNLWLRENGWVGGVRTHVNPLYLVNHSETASAPEPRATIRFQRSPEPEANPMALGPRPVSDLPITRMSSAASNRTSAPLFRVAREIAPEGGPENAPSPDVQQASAEEE